MHRLFDLPLLVILIGLGALAMYLPAAHALILNEHAVARAFFYPACIILVMAAVLALATSQYRPRNLVRSQVLSLLGAYVVLPVVLAVPMVEAMEGLRFVDAWFEMVSSFTTTGATVLGAPQPVPDSVNLWRGVIGWLGGFFVLLAVMALFMPHNLGGFEVVSGGPQRRRRDGGSARVGAEIDEEVAGRRLVAVTLMLAPAYAGLTVVLAIGLIVAGQAPLMAAILAMSTLSTSGIVMGGDSAVQAGLAGEGIILLFMVLALTRNAMPGTAQPGALRTLRRDPELGFAIWLVLLVGLMLFARHFIGALTQEGEVELPAALRVLWGSIFTAASFLTTTGFASAEWSAAQAWSGLGPAGLGLAGLALVGGGVATTAGGLKLLRVFALYRHGAREAERLIYPSSVAGRGHRARRLRRAGAVAAWVYFMLFVMTLVVVMALLTVFGLSFETALILSISAVTTTGPLASFAMEAPIPLAALSDTVKLVLALAMVAGRVELLALIALALPENWRG